MRALSLQQLRSFAEVVDRGSFSAAAARLKLTQPAVSLQIRNLERQLAVRLIERAGRRVTPTPAGRRLLEHVRRIEEECAVAIGHMQDYREHKLGRISIGTGATACIHLFPALLAGLRQRHPGLDISVSTGDTPELLDSVEASRLDLALVTLPAARRNLLIREVVQDPLVAVFPPHLSVPARLLGPRDLQDRQLLLYDQGGTIRTVIDGWFVSGGVRVKPEMELGSFEAMKRIVMSGVGCSILPSMTIARDEQAGRLQVRHLAPPVMRRYALAIRLDKILDKAMRAVVDAIESLGRASPPLPRPVRRAR